MFSKDFRAFLEENYRPAVSIGVSPNTIRDTYIQYAQENNKAAFNSGSFYKILKDKYRYEKGTVFCVPGKANNPESSVLPSKKEEIDTLIKEGIQKMRGEYESIENKKNAIVKEFLLAQIRHFNSYIKSVKDEDSTPCSFLTLKYHFILDYLNLQIQVVDELLKSD